MIRQIPPRVMAQVVSCTWDSGLGVCTAFDPDAGSCQVAWDNGAFGAHIDVTDLVFLDDQG